MLPWKHFMLLGGWDYHLLLQCEIELKSQGNLWGTDKLLANQRLNLLTSFISETGSCSAWSTCAANIVSALMCCAHNY